MTNFRERGTFPLPFVSSPKKAHPEFNDTYKENCVLLSSVQGFIEIERGLRDIVAIIACDSLWHTANTDINAKANC